MRALISVSDKTGVVDFARELVSLGWEILSTSGTMKMLKEAGIPVTSVSDVTGFPEICDGRVKTLHPKIHGALLARRDIPDHMRQLEENGIGTIDLVCVNLYPFRETVAKPDVTMEDAIEHIDIGGPSMVRSAAKNWLGKATTGSTSPAPRPGRSVPVPTPSAVPAGVTTPLRRSSVRSRSTCISVRSRSSSSTVWRWTRPRRPRTRTLAILLNNHLFVGYTIS